MYDNKNQKQYKVVDQRTEHGRSRSLIECPFCKNQDWAYWWSIAGSGKKCTGCGAIHNSVGTTAPLLKKK